MRAISARIGSGTSLTPRSFQERVKPPAGLFGQTSYSMGISEEQTSLKYGPASDSTIVSTARVGTPAAEGFTFDIYTEIDTFIIFPFSCPGIHSYSS